MKDKYIEIFQSLKNKSIHDQNELEVWKAKAINTLRRIYGPNSAQEEQINDIRFRLYAMGGGNNLDNCVQKAYGYAEGIIDELTDLGLPENQPPASDEKINITVHQSQAQEQNIKLKVILNALQDELTGKQLKELQEILDSENSEDEKKNQLIEKAKSFGSDVLANIIANLLTNPIFG